MSRKSPPCGIWWSGCRTNHTVCHAESGQENRCDCSFCNSEELSQWFNASRENTEYHKWYRTCISGGWKSYHSILSGIDRENIAMRNSLILPTVDPVDSVVAFETFLLEKKQWMYYPKSERWRKQVRLPKSKSKRRVTEMRLLFWCCWFIFQWLLWFRCLQHSFPDERGKDAAPFGLCFRHSSGSFWTPFNWLS